MWAKPSDVLKHRSNVDESETDQQHILPQSSTVALSPKETDQMAYHSIETSNTPSHDRSQSFRFGQTGFHDMPKAKPGAFRDTPPVEPSPGRNRAVTESTYHTLSRNNKSLELEINDPNPASIMLYMTPSVDRVPNLSPSPPEPDSFRVDATTFYTPGTLVPPSPPTAVVGHVRKPSKEEDLIWSLQTQLALQQELCTQYEVDLGARDALVSVLTQQVETADQENEKRHGAVRGWKKKVQELERLCRNLEEEVERSREESPERSVIDEPSGEALRQLHGQIAGLEHEKGELVSNSPAIFDPSVRLKDMEEERKAVRRREEEATKALVKKEQEMAVLRDELEAQWKNTERMGASMERLKEERNVLQSKVVALEAKIESMQRERAQLEAGSDNLNSIRQELKTTHDNVARLEQDIQQRDSELEGLAHRIVDREDEAQDARKELATLKREHARAMDEYQRALADLTTRAEGAQAELGTAVRDKDGADATVNSQRVGSLEVELEKLRKQIRDLQTESANREVHIAQMEKQRERDREDLQGLNIALDSKQQELELTKRRMGVKETVGTTPAPSKVGHIRRESTTATLSPSNTRPASRLSDASKDAPKAEKTSELFSTTARVAALGKSVRINTTSTTPPSTASNKIPTPLTVEPARAVDVRQRASLSTTISPTGVVSTRVSSTSSVGLGRPGAKSPPVATTARVPRRPLPDVDRSTSDSASDEKENTMRPSPRLASSLSAASKRRSMLAVPSS